MKRPLILLYLFITTLLIPNHCVFGVPPQSPSQDSIKYGIILGTDVNVRLEPKFSARIIANIRSDMDIVDVVGIASKTDSVEYSNKRFSYPWVFISYNNITGYVYGQLIEVVDTREKANNFIKSNIEIRKFIAGQWIFRPPNDPNSNDGEYDYNIIFHQDGTLHMKVYGVIGDHIESEMGSGRYYIFPHRKELSINALLDGTFHPDGVSWESYFRNDARDNEELARLIKERERYKKYRQFKLPIEDYKYDLKFNLTRIVK